MIGQCRADVLTRMSRDQGLLLHMKLVKPQKLETLNQVGRDLSLSTKTAHAWLMLATQSVDKHVYTTDLHFVNGQIHNTIYLLRQSQSQQQLWRPPSSACCYTTDHNGRNPACLGFLTEACKTHQDYFVFFIFENMYVYQ